MIDKGFIVSTGSIPILPILPAVPGFRADSPRRRGGGELALFDL